MQTLPKNADLMPSALSTRNLNGSLQSIIYQRDKLRQELYQTLTPEQHKKYNIVQKRLIDRKNQLSMKKMGNQYAFLTELETQYQREQAAIYTPEQRKKQRQIDGLIKTHSEIAQQLRRSLTPAQEEKQREIVRRVSEQEKTIRTKLEQAQMKEYKQREDQQRELYQRKIAEIRETLALKSSQEQMLGELLRLEARVAFDSTRMNGVSPMERRRDVKLEEFEASLSPEQKSKYTALQRQYRIKQRQIQNNQPARDAYEQWLESLEKAQDVVFTLKQQELQRRKRELGNQLKMRQKEMAQSITVEQEEKQKKLAKDFQQKRDALWEKNRTQIQAKNRERFNALEPLEEQMTREFLPHLKPEQQAKFKEMRALDRQIRHLKGPE
jgi:hypothetical protein